MDKEKTLAWLAEVSTDAIKEAREGNPIPANRMGGNPALAHYLNNVAGSGAVNANDWAHWYPHMLAEADALRTAAEHGEEQEQHSERLTSLEAKLGELAGLVGQIVEAKAVVKPKRKARKAKAKDEPVQELEEAEAVDVEESEAEAETENAETAPETDETEDAGADADAEVEAEDEPAEDDNEAE